MQHTQIAKILELIMLVCFGAAWPASILKSWKSRTAKGKSLFFLAIVVTGYLAGISKTLLLDGFGSFLLVAYTFNALMVSMDMALYFRNSSLDRLKDAGAARSE
ncbi:MAG: hypothetical protein LBG29_02940 [Synergistaceae bacterium]|jgi:hypothetical protein|nr:hypothetical protein [Synergistaceae bacterium]